MVTQWDAMTELEKDARVSAEEPPLPDAEKMTSASGSKAEPSHAPWPKPLAPEAYHGVTGEVVKAIAPHTEANPAAILVTFLVYTGNAIGRGPHALADGARHGTNLNAVLVGETSKGRKGSSSSQVQGLMRRVEPDWTDTRIMGGLSSGEGLIWAVRDAIEKTDSVKENGKHTGEYQTFEADPGVKDKRLPMVESEFASVLKVMSREASTLSTQIRQAWDSGDLRTLTKNNPAKATGAHVSIMGHVTKDELRRCLTETEMGNGFANRFLWNCTKRAQVLPEGGGIPNYHQLMPKLNDALEQAGTTGELRRDDEAREAWGEIYPALSEGKPGLFGSVTARAEAQVLRLSVLYAALDGADSIRLPHLKAALAVWEYTEDSARYIFGDATGDPRADRIYEALCQSGELARTEMSKLFSRHASADRISQALLTLSTAGKARMEMRMEGEGRPTEVWVRA